MKEDTRNHWKLGNLGKISPLTGIRRIAADPHYKGSAIIDPDYNGATVRCIDGGGSFILVGAVQ